MQNSQQPPVRAPSHQLMPMMRQPLPPPSSNLNPQYYHQPSLSAHHPAHEAYVDSYGVRRIRRINPRRSIDYTSSVVCYVQARLWQRDPRDRTILQPTPAALIDMLPAVAYSDNPSMSFAAKFVHASQNKNRCSVNCVVWTPNGRRLLTGSQSGEFTIWNGQSFNYELIIQGHDQAIRSMLWSHNGNWMISGDDGGCIRYWQHSMNNVKVNKSAHKESVQDLSFCRTDLKFCSCSDDAIVKVWDFARCQEERSLTGHGSDVKSVDWHPTKSLLASGAKDSLVKLWDAKTGRELCNFHGHKNSVLCVKWNENGNWVLTASKDQIIKLYDIRAMKEFESYRGHQKDVTALSWHPFNEDYFVSGSFDGSIFHWLVGHENPQIEVCSAHDNSVWDLAWHPIGYILCSGSNDFTTKFWSRHRPGDTVSDKFSMPQSQGPFATGTSRSDGTISGIGVVIPLSAPLLNPSARGEVKHPLQLGPPPLPPGPHPSLIASSPQYQQIASQIPQHQTQSIPPPLVSMFPISAHNLQQMHLPHMPMLPHQLSRPPPHAIPPPLPSSILGSLLPSSSTPGVVGIQGVLNQMVPPLPQGHVMGINQLYSGSMVATSSPLIGGFPTVIPNLQGPVNPAAGQMFLQGGSFSRPQAGQIPLLPGFNLFQSGNQTGLPPPLPSGPPPHS